MAVQIEISWTCEWNPCDVRVPEGSDEVIKRTITIDNQKTRQAMFCKQHNADFDDFIMPILANGMTVDSPPKTTKKRSTAPSTEAEPSTQFQWTCAEPDCGRLIKNNVGMAQHVGPRGHGYESLDAYKAAHGLT